MTSRHKVEARNSQVVENRGEDEPERATPVWFGPAKRPLFGWLHLPAGGRSRGGVLLCSPLGRDSYNTHSTYRLLARHLQRAGLVALRFDYDGTGDSAGGTDEPARVQAWLGSVAHAAQLIRSLNVPSFGLVGMRTGASVAALYAASDGAVSSLVLWDPISGRSFLREQQALGAVSLGTVSRADGCVETPGTLWAAETVRDLVDLDVCRTQGPLAGRVLLLTRAGQTAPGQLIERLSMPHVERTDVSGQPELIDVSTPFQTIPHQAVERVTAWLTTAMGAENAPVMSVPPPARVEVATLPSGEPVMETPLELGELGLFGIECRAGGDDTPTGPTVVFINVSNEPHLGPNRLWVELSRRWAAYGLRSVRFDLSGLGDSPVRIGQAEGVVRAPEAFDDVAEVVRALSREDPTDVVLVGMCASAYQAIESALRLQPRGLFAVNPLLSFVPPEIADGPLDPRRRVCQARTPLVAAFRDGGRFASIMRRAPNTLWFVRNIMARRRRPAVWVKELLSGGVDVLFVCGEHENRQIEQGSRRSLQRMSRTGHLQREVVTGLDHGLMAHRFRISVADILTKQVCTHFVSTDGNLTSEVLVTQ